MISIITILALLSFIYYILNVYYSDKYHQEKLRNDIDISKATIVVPVYKENVTTFSSVIMSIKNQGVKFIVVGDSSNEPYKSITEKYGGTFILLKEHVGKRMALVEGISHIVTPYVMLVDSDTVLPANALKDMLSNFKDNIGGVSVNIKIRQNGTKISYASEFIERAREVVFRAMSYHGSILVADGRCAMYRTDLIKPYMMSDDFKNKRILGKKTMLGDDIQITSYLIKNKYRVVKDYNVVVETDSQENFKKFVHQQVRWARNGWYYFFKNLSNGTTRSAGKFYTFEVLYLYIVPFVGFLLLLYRMYFIWGRFGYYDSMTIENLGRRIFFEIFPIDVHFGVRRFDPVFLFILMDKLATLILGVTGNALFITAVMIKIPRDRLRTLGYGAIAIAIMFLANLYGFFTFWKQSKWLTR